jgi:anti-anti-sigma factor
VVAFRIDPCNGRGVFALVGELDMLSAEACLETLSGPARTGELWLDASSLTFVDSSGIRTLVMLGRLGDGIRLSSVRPNVRRALEIVGIDDGAGIKIED